MRRACLLSLILLAGCQTTKPTKAPSPTAPDPISVGKKSNKPYPTNINALYIRAFKSEKELELWIQEKPNQKYTHYHTYPVLRASGRLGPKRKEYDGQVPEGFYEVDRFNPNSQFHLSLGLNYPNDSDKVRSDTRAPGTDIFIHGSNVSIGCLAMGNDPIEEIYAIAETAKKSGNKIRVDIFPFRMTETNIETYSKKFPQWSDFWKNELEIGYMYFENAHMPAIIHPDETGRYRQYKT
jgi:murein L,D-transpeptidase YafK